MAREKITAPDVSIIEGRIITPKAAGERKGKRGEFRFDQFGYFRKSPRKPCEWKEKDKPFPLGRTELDIISVENAERLRKEGATGIVAGPSIRLCYAKNEAAPVLSVSDPQKAQEIAAHFRDCIMDGGEHKACAVKTLEKFRPGEPVTIAGAPKKTARGVRAPKRKARK